MAVEFDTTDWRLVADACSPSIATRDGAIRALFESYMPPIEQWFRRCRVGPQRASELAQDFFSTVVMERRLLAGTDPSKGRLRTLLKKAASNYLTDVRRRQDARERAETQAAQANSETVGARTDDAETSFDAEWARRQLEIAVMRSRDVMLSTGREREWAVFERSIYVPCIHGGPRPQMADVARAVGLPNAAAASSLLHTARQRVHAMFKEVVSETVSAAEDYREEIAHIESVFRAAARR